VASQRGAERRVLDLRVPVERGSAEPLAQELGLEGRRRRCIGAAVPSEVVSPRERGIEKESDLDEGRGAARMLVVRNEERQGANILRSGPEQNCPLAERLPDEADLSGFEVADPAVDQLRGSAAGPRGQIPRLEQQDPKSPERGIARDRDALDASADDQDIDDRIPP
jgi:hypothetical protein